MLNLTSKIAIHLFLSITNNTHTIENSTSYLTPSLTYTTAYLFARMEKHAHL